MQKISILIVDDHKLVRETWIYLLNTVPSFHVAASCSSAEEAIRIAEHLHPGVILLDINLPGMNGLEATCIFRQVAPGSKILAVSVYTQTSYVRKMLKNGALGYVTKNSSRQEMIHAIKEVHAGHQYLCEEIRKNMEAVPVTGKNDDDINELSQREMEVIDLLKKGYSSKEIANRLFISVKTVEAHRHNILKKLKIKNAAALVNFINTGYEKGHSPYPFL